MKGVVSTYKKRITVEKFNKWREQWRAGDNSAIKAQYGLSQATIVEALRHGIASPKTEALIDEYFENKAKAN